MRLSVTAAGPGEAHHVVVEATADTPLAEVARSIAAAVGADPSVDLYVGERRLERSATLADAGLHDGAVVGLGGPCAGPPDPYVSALVEVHAVSGAGAGLVFPMVLGSYPVGSAPWCAIRVPGAPAHAATLTVRPDGAVLITAVEGGVRLLRAVDPERNGGAAMDGEDSPSGQPEIADAAPDAAGAVTGDSGPGRVDPGPIGPGSALLWPADADLAVGATTLLRWAFPGPPDGRVEPSEDGIALDFNRPPRIIEPIPERRFRMPPLPRRPPRRAFPILIVVLPALLGIAMVWMLHSVEYLFLAAFSPVFMIANYVSARHSGRKTYRHAMADYRVAKAKLSAEVTDAVRAERLARLSVRQDPAAVLLTATGPDRRLWERRRDDPDHLVLRVGTADRPSRIGIDTNDMESRRTLHWPVPSVPVDVSLPDSGVIGLAGPPERINALAAWLVAQTAVAHTPRDVRFVLLTEPDAAARWEWTRWLPHLRSPLGSPVAMVGNDPETVAHRVGELASLVMRRHDSRGSMMRKALFDDPDVVLVVDGARRMREVPGLAQILADGPAVQVYAICLDRDVNLLPQEAAAVLLDGPGGMTLRRKDEAEIPGIRPDLVGPDWCDAVARSVAAMRDATPEDGHVLPEHVSLPELLGLHEPDAALIAARWRAVPAGTTVPIGMGYEGALAVDLVRDGPHALIAGTTGSGKSELLQTLVASLAVANRPDELTFLLIDYKGGSAFRECVDLPHTLGMVTDLDEHLVGRVLRSLGAELRRRERLLAEHGAKDHPGYQAQRALDPDLPALPRLVLVVDEFATLVREVPEFVTGLVSIAQRGRSLGLHMVLATQRPAGVVSSDIKANTNLRIALRVTDPSESVDVIDTNDAVTIPPSVPGRALIRRGHRAVTPFQTAYSGAPHGAEYRRPDSWAVAVPWLGLGRTLIEPERRGEPREKYSTDLSVLVDALKQAAADLAVEPQPKPWVPALPNNVTLAGLPPVSQTPAGPGGIAPIPFGLEDLPVQQVQVPVTLDLDTFPHLYIVGATRSGRTEALRTIAGAVALRVSSADVHIYGIDAAGGALAVLSALPHTGTVAGRGDLERIDRLLTRLGQELSRRQELLAEHHAGNLAELRAVMPPGPRPAHLLVMIDGWDALYSVVQEYDGGRLTDELIRLLREGAAAGVHLIIAGDRGLIVGRIGSLNENRLMLRMTDRSDFLTLGMSMSELPTVLPPGRGWRSGSKSEVQLAMLTEDASGQTQAETVRRIGKYATERDGEVGAASRPFAVGELPFGIDFATAYRAVPRPRPLVALLGIAGDEGAPVMCEFTANSHVYKVVGPPGSGRSTVLATMAVSLLDSGTGLVVIAPRESPLRRLGGDPKVKLLTSAAASAQEVRDAVEALGSPCVVMVDDAELISQMPPCDAALREVVATGRDRGIGLALSTVAETFSQGSVGWLKDARTVRKGLLLAPQAMLEGDIIGTRIPANLLRRPARPGRGYIADPRTGAMVSIALPLTVLRDAESGSQ